MEWNIAAECISLVMLGIIWVYARKGSRLPSLKNRIFQWCVMVTFSAIFTNILSTVMIYNYVRIPMWSTLVVTMIYFVLTPLMGLAYFLYTLSVIYADSSQIRRIASVGIIPGAVYTLVILSNPFTNWIFDLNMNDGYIRGPFISVTYLVFYAYCIASIVFTLVNRRQIDREIYRILAAFPVLAVAVIIVQQVYPSVILSGAAATCALLIIYLHLQNRQISIDYLTNVPNRQELLDMLGLVLKKTPKKTFVLAVVSLRDFRQINNACGQQKGDEFLKAMCQFLQKTHGGSNVYRFSGDEFALLFTQEDETQIKKCVETIQERMEQPWQIDEFHFKLNVVIGVVQYSGEGESLEKLINSIEYAVSQAKSGKCGQICYCNKEMLESLERRRKVIRILKEKLEDESFQMYYQPIYSVRSGQFYYAESLMRIPDSPIGPIYPSEFIPIAEETGLIINITYVVLNKVCKFINCLMSKGIYIGSIHVNFSAMQFSQPNLAERVLAIIEANGTPPSSIKIEFTESTLAENPQLVTDFALKMKAHGIKMGLDDFGTGYSNIATVINIPFGTVKLDKSLVWVSMKNENSALAVRNLTRTFKELGMKVVAEGVETEEQRKLVVDFGVDQIQGFYYAKPMPEVEMETFMLAQSKKEQRC